MNMTQTSDLPQTYKYFAFISYSSKDAAWGRTVQRKLERYRLPARLASKRKDAPARAYPIFRDETDLSGFKVRDALEQELAQSRFLIVICSPNSAQSAWVNDEIRYFIDHGWEDRILPFIVAGTPYSADPATECFPPALRNMAEDPLGVDVTALGKHRAFLRLISALLDVKFDELIRRDAARRTRNGIILGLSGVLAAAALGFGIWYNTEHSKLYNAVTFQNEIPVGLYPVSQEEFANATDTYRITTLRGRVVRLENINALGTVKEPDFINSFTEYPVLEFQYDDSGELISIAQIDETGKELFRKDLTVNKETREIAIDFHSPGNVLNAQALSADMTSSGMLGDDDTKSEITRQRNTYDENGYLIRTLYQRDNLGTPACDSNIVYGKQYEYDSLGQVIRISNLDERGRVFNCKYGWAYEAFTYDDRGNPVRSQFFDAQGNPALGKQGYSGTEIQYDSHGNALIWRRFDENGAPMECFPATHYEYGTSGMVSGWKVFAADGTAAYDANGVHETRIARDKLGRVCGFSYFDSDGNPVYSPAMSCAAYKTALDAQGRILELWKYGTDGELVFNRSIGAYGQRSAYDENGNRIRIEYLDAQGQLMICSDGHAVSIAMYDDAGRAIREEYRDTQGNLVRNADNVAAIEITYDTFGNYSGSYYYDENGDPCYHAEGYSFITLTYEDGNPVSIAYFDTDGSPMLFREFYHKLCQEFDEKGNPIRWSYYDTEGNLLDTTKGYALLEQDYDTYGNVTAQRFFSSQMEPVMVDGYYAVSWEYDNRGNKIRETLSTYAPDQLNYTVLEMEYDASGNRIRDRYYDQNGNPVVSETFCASKEYTYDEKGNQTQILWLDHTGTPMQAGSDSYENIRRYTYDQFGSNTLLQHLNRDASGKEICLWQERYTFDAFGNCILEEHLDGNGDLRLTEDNYAALILEYSPQGHLIAEEFYDEKNRPCLFNEAVFRYEYTRNPMGKITQMRIHGTDGKLLKEADGYAAYTNYTYDTRGYQIQKTHLNEKGEPYATEADSISSIEYFVDAMGYDLGRAYYDKNGQLLYRDDPYTLISAVFPGSAAEAAGIQVADFLIYWDGWDMFDLDIPSPLHKLQTTLASSVHRETELVVCTWDDNDQFHFRRITLPEGAAGFRVQSDVGNADVLARIEDAYLQWLSKNP